MNKTALLDRISEAQRIIADNNSMNDALRSGFAECEDSVKNFSADVLFVGGFSAGKTALINSLLGGDEILRENITPETAIPSEIIYGSPEKIIRVKENGQKELSTLAAINELTIDGFSKYIYVLNNPALKEFTDLVLVDMPGFDSGIETHNKALMQYIGRGAGYVFVVDLEKGTLSKSALDFLAEIKSYSGAVIFVLTKRDKLLPSDVESVKDNIAEILEAELGAEPSILVTSSREEDCGKRLSEFIRQFSADGLMMKKFKPRAATLLRQGLQAMYVQLSAIDFNPRELDMAIMNQERRKESVQEEMKRAKRKLHENFQTEVPAKILGDVESSLRSQLPSLVSAAKQGNQAFSAAVNNILRPLLVNTTQQYIEAGFDDYAESIGTIGESADVIASKLTSAVDSFTSIAEHGKKYANANKYKGLYQVMSTGLALTTNIVAPWLELIIIFLPDLLGVLRGITGRSRDEELRDRIEGEIIPQICGKLRPDIKAALLKAEEEQSAAIDEEFNSALANEAEALQKLKDEKDERKLDVERRKKDLNAGISRLQEIVDEIEESE